MSTFSETTTNVIEGVTSMQQQFMALQERVNELESLNADYVTEIEEKTEMLESLDYAKEAQADEIRRLRNEIKKLRRRPDGVKVSGSVHVQQTRSNNRRNHSPKKNRQKNQRRNNPPPTSSSDPTDNIPASFSAMPIPPEVAEQLIQILMAQKQN